MLWVGIGPLGLTIHYGAGKQIRELQMSGGFSSYDAPALHYGLGENTQVDRVEIEWSTGEKTQLAGPFPANATYRIERQGKSRS